MKKIREFLKERTGQEIVSVFGYDLNRYIDYSYRENGIIKATTYYITNK